ncbi:uridine kinase [Nakamurella sp. YIM 132087]|uniref:Uridine kinase n=1 Tax=Nakamurella alba TaxID=2665158 RepID=A0A7K1FK80_9ACTN|nr:uridine kinase [Nakamurella alba]MTD14547.1 uridine kinase [Nakamurella alba]
MRFTPVSPDRLARAIADRVATGRSVVVGIDGDPAIGAGELADRVAEAVRAGGRQVIRADLSDWWRPASVRLEYGHEDVDSLLDAWVDVGALDRELLVPLREGRPIRVRNWDALADRAFREAAVDVAPTAVLVLAGAFLGRVVPDADLTVQLQVKESTLRRLLPGDRGWWLEGHRLDREQRSLSGDPVGPDRMVVSYDHPAAPAIGDALPIG